MAQPQDDIGDATSLAAKSGRDERGRWISNDATAEQVLGVMLGALDDIAEVLTDVSRVMLTYRSLAERNTVGVLLARLAGRRASLREMIALVDVGQRPATGDAPAESPDSDGQWT